jgi:lysophospholipase L1-like esterase
MTTIELADPAAPVTIEGALDVRTKGGAVRPWRLPTDDLDLHHPMLVFMASLPAGVRLRLRTDSRTLTLHADHVSVPELEGWQPVYDLTVDGVLHQQQPAPRHGGPATVTFTDLPGALEQTVEVWLPNNRGVRLLRLDLDDGAAAERAPDDRPRWLVYGSSITHAMEARGPSRAWPAVAAAPEHLDRHLTSLGVAGMCHLDPLVARAIAAKRDVDHLTFKLGINIHNGATLRERTFAPLVQGFLSTVRDGHPETPITIVSPILSPEREDDPNSTRTLLDGSTEQLQGELTLRHIRELLHDVVERRRRRGDGNITYLDGRELFGVDDDDLRLLPDGLHPDGDGQELMGRRYAALVAAGSCAG